MLSFILFLTNLSFALCARIKPLPRELLTPQGIERELKMFAQVAGLNPGALMKIQWTQYGHSVKSSDIFEYTKNLSIVDRTKFMSKDHFYILIGDREAALIEKFNGAVVKKKKYLVEYSRVMIYLRKYFLHAVLLMVGLGCAYFGMVNYSLGKEVASKSGFFSGLLPQKVKDLSLEFAAYCSAAFFGIACLVSLSV